MSNYFSYYLGAKRERDHVMYMIKMKGSNGEKFVTSAETKKFAVNVIDFLQSKIVFQNHDNDDQPKFKMIDSNAEPNSVICEWTPT